MKAIKFFVLYIVFFMGVISSVAEQVDEVRFFKGSYKDLTERASNEGKSYIIFFTKENCPPCERMKEDTFTDPALAELIMEKSFIYEAEIPDVDAYALAGEYGVVGYPTMLLFSPSGVLLGRLVGGQSVDSLTEYILSMM